MTTIGACDKCGAGFVSINAKYMEAGGACRHYKKDSKGIYSIPCQGKYQFTVPMESLVLSPGGHWGSLEDIKDRSRSVATKEGG